MRARPHGRVGRLRARLAASRRQVGLSPTCRRNRAAGPSGVKLQRPARENGMHCASTHTHDYLFPGHKGAPPPANPDAPTHSANSSFAFCILHFHWLLPHAAPCSRAPHRAKRTKRRSANPSPRDPIGRPFRQRFRQVAECLSVANPDMIRAWNACGTFPPIRHAVRIPRLLTST